jgi:D-arabinose 1-dehydrogenase-like Zn-dependent alcohol dehydrogenase
MKAIKVTENGLIWQPFPDLPTPGEQDVVINVAWAGVNRADLMQRSGFYPPPPGASAILGLEVSGRVAGTGAGVTHLKPGDEVCALLTGGGYASQVLVPATQVLPVPAGLSLEQAAALPEVFATAWLNLYMEAALKPGERILLHAAKQSSCSLVEEFVGLNADGSAITHGNGSVEQQQQPQQPPYLCNSVAELFLEGKSQVCMCVCARVCVCVCVCVCV